MNFLFNPLKPPPPYFPRYHRPPLKFPGLKTYFINFCSYYSLKSFDNNVCWPSIDRATITDNCIYVHLTMIWNIAAHYNIIPSVYTHQRRTPHGRNWIWYFRSLKNNMVKIFNPRDDRADYLSRNVMFENDFLDRYWFIITYSTFVRRRCRCACVFFSIPQRCVHKCVQVFGIGVK